MSGISILMYHQVGHFKPMKTHRASYCDAGRFKRQMLALKWLGIPVLSLEQALAALSGQAPMPERAVVLSFDDGCVNFMEHALPVLQDLGHASVMYPVAGLLGGKAEWLAADNHPQPPLMSAAQLREIAAAGVTVGSHALSHLRLAGLSREVQRKELRESRERLEAALGQPVQHLCYPYGSHDLVSLEEAAAAGYRSAVTCQRGAATPGDFDLLALPRKAISYGDTLPGFLWKVYMKDEPKGQAVRRTPA